MYSVRSVLHNDVTEDSQVESVLKVSDVKVLNGQVLEGFPTCHHLILHCKKNIIKFRKFKRLLSEILSFLTILQQRVVRPRINVNSIDQTGHSYRISVPVPLNCQMVEPFHTAQFPDFIQ